MRHKDSQLAISCHQARLSSRTELLDKLFPPGKSPNNPVYCEDKGLLSTSWRHTDAPSPQGTHYLRKTPTQLIQHGILTPTFISLGQEVFYRLLKEKWEHKPIHKTLDLQSVLLIKYARATAAQNLWEWPINVWSDLRFTPQEGIHTRYSLGNKEPETRQPRDLW